MKSDNTTKINERHIREYPNPEKDGRMETGPVRFGDDWAGVFIRGDNAMWFAYCLNRFLEAHQDDDMWSERACLEGLLSDLQSCQE